MHQLQADAPIMVCEDVHAMLVKRAPLQRDVNDWCQKQFTAGSELIVWPGECLPSHRTVRMSTILLCCVFCILMLSALIQAVPCDGLWLSAQAGVETSSLHLCRHTGRSTVANAAIGIQHSEQQLPTRFGFAHSRRQKQQGGLSHLSCVAC